MRILRQEKDEELKTYCYLISFANKLYFLHACEQLPLINDNQFDIYIAEHQNTTELVAIEDIETINYYYHVSFETENQLIEELLNLKKEIFIDLFFLSSIENMEHIDSNENYLRKCIIFHQLFGNTYAERLLNQPEISIRDLQQDFIYSDGNDICENNGGKMDLYIFSNLYEGEISDIVTYGCMQSFRSILFDTESLGLLSYDFLFKELTKEEYAEKVCLFYRMEQFGNPVEVQKKLKRAERKWKIEILLNPYFLVKKAVKNDA